MREIYERMLIQAFVSKSAVEGVDVGILLRLAGFNAPQLHAALVRLGDYRVVAPDDLWIVA